MDDRILLSGVVLMLLLFCVFAAKSKNVVIVTVAAIASVVGLYWYQRTSAIVEAMTAAPPARTYQELTCPNLLIRRGDRFFLYNTRIPNKDDPLHPVFSNPQIFHSLSEYIRYFKDERKRGSTCPLAYFEEEKRGDGEEDLYHEQSLDDELARAIELDSYRAVVPFYPESTQKTIEPVPRPPHHYPVPLQALESRQEQGVHTESDEFQNLSALGGFPVAPNAPLNSIGAGIPGISLNPADPNWGGPRYTQLVMEDLR